MLEMVIDSIRVSLMNYQRVVILKRRDSDQYLPIWIGSAEADAIAVKLQDVNVPRPLTHDLVGSIITSLGATVDHIVVSDISNDTFYAKLVLQTKDGQLKEIDCRPSDALAIAVRGGHTVLGPDGQDHWFSSPPEAQRYLEQIRSQHGEFSGEVKSKVAIFVDENVLEKAGIVMDKDSGKDLGGAVVREAEVEKGNRPVTEEELRTLSAFSEFLKDLPGLEELGDGGEGQKKSGS